MRLNESKTVTIKAGKYFMGDPCYAFSHDTDSWDKICDQLHDDDKKDTGFVRLKGHIFPVFGTDHGDGCYESNHPGWTFPVDAGLIGLVPFEIIEREPKEYEELGQVVTFDEDFVCSSDGQTITLGPYEIYTGYPEEDEDDYEDDEQDDNWDDEEEED